MMARKSNEIKSTVSCNVDFPLPFTQLTAFKWVYYTWDTLPES